jgi:hypothetical protein
MVHILNKAIFIKDDFGVFDGVVVFFVADTYIYFAIELVTSIPNSPPPPYLTYLLRNFL